MLIKRKDGSAGRARLQGVAAGLASGVLDRRTFLRRSGLTVGAGAALGLMPLGSVRKAQAGRNRRAPQVDGEHDAGRDQGEESDEARRASQGPGPL